MFINITIESGNAKQDIRIDSEQRIGEGLKVLRRREKLPHGSQPDYFRSCLNRRPVSAYKTFSEEQVFDGDILTVIE